MHDNDGHEGRLEKARDDERLLEGLDHDRICRVAPEENMEARPV